MIITLNNKTLAIPPNYTINALLEDINCNESVIVFVNNKKLLLSEYNFYVLKDNDVVKIIMVLAGG